MNTGWIDPGLVRDFHSEGTDAHRLCTIEDGWVECFGSDVLISFKKVLARERLLEELQTWAKGVGFPVRRVFARLIPTRNERREPPVIGRWRSGREFTNCCHGTVSEVWHRFRHGLFAGFVFGPAREPPVRASYCAKATAKLFRLYLFLFRVCSMYSSKHSQHRSFQKVSCPWT